MLSLRYLSAFFCLCLLLSFSNKLQAQGSEDEKLVQFSGLVLDGTTDKLIPVPYANILVVGKGRGSYADYEGFFSLVVETNDTIEFSAIGYETVTYIIPDEVEGNRLPVVQLMTSNDVDLPEIVVFPWPSREHFKLEFLAMDVTEDLQSRAAENLTAENLDKVRQTLAYDGVENSSYYLRRQAASNYYIGQRPPMNIFNPISWAQFFKSWKNGDFKKKKKSDRK